MTASHSVRAWVASGKLRVFFSLFIAHICGTADIVRNNYKSNEERCCLGCLIKGYGLFSLPVFLPLSLFVFDYLQLGFLPSIISLHQNNR